MIIRIGQFLGDSFRWVLGSSSLLNIFWVQSKWIPTRFKIILLREAITSAYSNNFMNLKGGLDQQSAERSLLKLIIDSKPRLAKLDQLFVSQGSLLLPKLKSKEIALISNTSDFTNLLQEFIFREPERNVTVVNLGEIKKSDPSRLFSKALLSACTLQPELFQLLKKEGWDKVLEESDTWFVDWCLDNAVIFSKIKPNGKKLILRIHRFDAFSWYGHLVDWSKVDGLIFVSKTIQSIFFEIHGRKVAGIPYVLARNAEISKFEIGVPRLKTLGILQYNREVKDPLFALNLLKFFREKDSEWKLFVAGPGWGSNHNSRLERDFFSFIQDNCLSSSVIIEGYQDNPSDWYKKIGFMVSSSLSEGSHEVIRESITAGSVPLIRNWPAIKEFGGAFGAYPELIDFIFETENEAYEIAKANLSRVRPLSFTEDDQMAIGNIECLLRASNP